jgi:hypothetical protein
VHTYTHTQYVCIYIQVRVFGENHENVAHSLHNLVLMSQDKGNCPEAMKYYQRSQEIFTRHKSPKVFSIVTLFIYLVNTLGR